MRRSQRRRPARCAASQPQSRASLRCARRECARARLRTTTRRFLRTPGRPRRGRRTALRCRCAGRVVLEPRPVRAVRASFPRRDRPTAPAASCPHRPRCRARRRTHPARDPDATDCRAAPDSTARSRDRSHPSPRALWPAGRACCPGPTARRAAQRWPAAASRRPSAGCRRTSSSRHGRVLRRCDPTVRRRAGRSTRARFRRGRRRRVRARGTRLASFAPTPSRPRNLARRPRESAAPSRARDRRTTTKSRSARHRARTSTRVRVPARP